MDAKRCSDCKQEKSKGDFYKNRSNRDGLQAICKLCSKRRVSEYVASGKHSEWSKASAVAMRADPVRLAKYRARELKARKARIKSDPAFNGKKKARQLRHYRANREQYYVRVSARKARKLGTGGSHSVAEWLQMLDLFGGKCLCCGGSQRVTKDHVVPLSRGGTDNISNIQPLCIWCNKSKFTSDRDYRTREKVALADLNAVGRLIFDCGDVGTLERSEGAYQSDFS